jgi:hypothetical protein
VSGLGRVGAAVRRGAVRLVPAGRRDWVEAVWAEAPEVAPGVPRLAWRAGAARLTAREALMRRGICTAMLFAAAAAVAAWAAWPGSPTSVFTPVGRVYVIAMVLLAGLPVLARPFLGPAGDSRSARLLRAGTSTALLALIPARSAVGQFSYMPPRGAADLLLFRLVAPHPHHAPWGNDIVVLVVMALYAAAILRMTSRRSRVAPATLAIGASAGIVFGLVMYAVAPLGLSQEATNPWLPGSDIDPLVVLAWLLLLGAPMAAAIAADRRFIASSSSPPTVRARLRQILAAGLLTSLTGALSFAAVGYGTVAVMVKAAWLRNWLYHGQHLLYGVQNLSSDLKTLPAIAYSHQITGSVDAGAFIAILIVFPVIALATTVLAAMGLVGDTPAGRDDPRRGDGGSPGPEPAPDPPADGRLADLTDDHAGQLVAASG